jgi:Ca-activated chloride channel family protein
MNFRPLLIAIFAILCMPFFSAQENYNTLVFKGNQDFDKKNYENASGKYLKAVQLNEKDFAAHYNLGNSLYKRKLFAEAKAEYEKALQNSTNLPDKAAALYNLGNMEMESNNSKNAAAHFKAALKQDPYNESIRKNYEIAMLKEKEKEEKKQDKKSQSGRGNGKDKDENTGTDPGKNPQSEAGSGVKNKGEGDNPKNSENDNPGKMPSDLEKSLLDRVENKERETAKKLLNKNSYSTPESNEKDW